MDEPRTADEIVQQATATAEKVIHDARGAAQVVLSTAERTAERLVREATTEPTNSELQRNIALQSQRFELHAKENIEQFLAIDERIDNLATREDIQRITDKLDPVLDVYKAVLLSKGFVTGLAGVVVAIGAIGAGFIWLINSVISPK